MVDLATLQMVRAENYSSSLPLPLPSLLNVSIFDFFFLENRQNRELLRPLVRLPNEFAKLTNLVDITKLFRILIPSTAHSSTKHKSRTRNDSETFTSENEKFN